MKLRIDRLAPKCKKSKTDIEETKRVTPKMETVEPTLAKLRNDNEEPKCKKSNTDKDDPTRAKLRMDTEDPK